MGCAVEMFGGGIAEIRVEFKRKRREKRARKLN
jgi:hypothetical protein